MKIGIHIAALLGIFFAAPTFAQKSADDHSADHSGVQAQSAILTEGAVRKVDKSAKKITIKHGPIVNLDMPAMTMVFQVKDPVMLEQVKVGDKVKFYVENLGGAYTVTSIEQAN